MGFDLLLVEPSGDTGGAPTGTALLQSLLLRAREGRNMELLLTALAN